MMNLPRDWQLVLAGISVKKVVGEFVGLPVGALGAAVVGDTVVGEALGAAVVGDDVGEPVAATL